MNDIVSISHAMPWQHVLGANLIGATIMLLCVWWTVDTLFPAASDDLGEDWDV